MPHAGPRFDDQERDWRQEKCSYKTNEIELFPLFTVILWA